MKLVRKPCFFLIRVVFKKNRDDAVGLVLRVWCAKERGWYNSSCFGTCGVFREEVELFSCWLAWFERENLLDCGGRVLSKT